jgi:hypothetical protein
MGWTQVPLAKAAWVQIPQLSLRYPPLDSGRRGNKPRHSWHRLFLSYGAFTHAHAVGEIAEIVATGHHVKSPHQAPPLSVLCAGGMGTIVYILGRSLCPDLHLLTYFTFVDVQPTEDYGDQCHGLQIAVNPLAKRSGAGRGGTGASLSSSAETFWLPFLLSVSAWF